jgi:restriction system protein
MRTKIDSRVPRYSRLITPTFNALRELGGSGSNEEILNQVIADLAITDEIADISHQGNTNMSELQY